MIPQHTSVQRLVGVFAQHGINSAMLVQLQHLQELALAVNLQGKHLVDLNLFSGVRGLQDLTVSAVAKADGWDVDATDATRILVHKIEIPREADETDLWTVQGQLSDAISELMQLLEEGRA